MSFSSFQIAVSGMKANQDNMAVIGNNISNVNTDGFKGARYQFQDVLSQEINSPLSQTVNVNEVGMGVTGVTANLMTQGAMAPGASDKDMAIEGDGFFIIANGSTTEYTRVGNFRPNEFEDKIVLSDNATGYILQGWNATYPFATEAPSIDTTETPENIEIGLGTFERGRASNFVTFTGNLNASEEIQDSENVLNSAALTDGVNPISGTTDLKTVVNPADPSNLLFPGIDELNGQITIKAFKGDLQITETFVYGRDGLTVNDFMEWSKNALGLSTPTSPDALFAPGGVALSTDGVISISSGTGANQKIKEIELSFRNDTDVKNILNFTESINSTPQSLTNKGIKVIDEDGVEHQIDVTFTKSKIETDGTTWTFNLESSENFAAVGTRLIDSGTIKFGLEGEILEFQPNLTSFNFLDSDGASKEQFLNLDFNSLTQLSSANGSQIAYTQDGFPKGTLIDYYIDDSGTIIGKYDSGFTEEIGKVALASFMNSENLIRTSNGNWSVFNADQVVTIEESGAGKSGNIRSRFREQSNVDLTTEFAKLIVAQRSFQSVSNALQVSNEILRNLASLGL